MVDESRPADLEPKPTRKEACEEAAASRALAESLARGKPAELPDPPFEGELKQAVLDARRFVKNAKPRRIRRLAALLRQAGSVEMFTQAIDGTSLEHAKKRAHERAMEAWRARLLAEGDGALDALMAEVPNADRRQLRQWMRQARRAPAEARSKRAATSLLRAIRSAFEARDADAPDA